MSEVIAFCFAGRKKNLEVLIPYVRHLIQLRQIDRFDIWNFSWTKEDWDYVNSLEGLHENIYIKRFSNELAVRSSELAGKQIKHVFGQAYNECTSHMLKIDDDMVFIDIERFKNFRTELVNNKNHFTISANVLNNKFRLSSLVASYIHYKFLKKQKVNIRSNVFWKNLFALNIHDLKWIVNKIFYSKVNSHIKTNQRVSINFCGWSPQNWQEINAVFEKRNIGLNDEAVITIHLAECLGLSNYICSDFRVVHYSFGGQTNLDYKILAAYKNLAQRVL